MRTTATILVIALGLAACNKGKDEAVTANADTGLTAETIAANDVTAIDAVTGAAANMAADVDYSNVDMNEGLDNATDSAPGARAATHKRAAPPRPARSETPSPATDDTAPATVNQQ